MAVVRTEEFKGVKVPIDCNQDGRFTARLPFDGTETIGGATLEEVVKKVRAGITREQAKNEIEITLLGCKFTGYEVTRGEDGEAFDAILRGVAERTDRLMLTIGGKKIQTDYMGRHTTVARRLTAAEVSYYKALVKTRDAAEKDLNDFVAGVRIDPRKATEGVTNGGE